MEQSRDSLVTFGIEPDSPSTAYSYLELRTQLGEHAQVLQRFHEKPNLETARGYYELGPVRYLWNSRMFVRHSETILECIRRYVPAAFERIPRIAHAWDQLEPAPVLRQMYGELPKISIDCGLPEPASRDNRVPAGGPSDGPQLA